MPETQAENLKKHLGKPKLEPQTFAHEVLTEGLLKKGLKDRQVKKVVIELTDAFCNDLEQIQQTKKPSETFAALMNSIDFGDSPPRLELGVVVKDKSAKFWLCIQPLCDSVRLQGKRAFPLMPLEKCADKPDAMIRDGDDFVAVSFQQHPYELKMLEFTPKEETGTVTATGGPSNWQFKSVDGCVYHAVTRLRFEFAAKAVQGFASSASRVGVNVSEWLRRGGAY